MDTLSRARAYLAVLPSSVSGQHGHDAAFRAACVLVKGFALSPAEALTLLHEFNGRCQPAWNERDLAHKVADAVRASDSRPRGWLVGPVIPPARKATEIRWKL